MPDWSLIGGDPAPGRPDVIDGIGRAWRDVSRNAGVARTTLQVAGDGVPAAGWAGSAADATANRILLVVPHVDQLAASYQDAATALVRFADTLRGLQTRAQRVCEEAEDAARMLQEAQSAQRQAQQHQDAARQRRDEAGRLADRLTRQARQASTPEALALIQRQLVDAKARLNTAQKQLRDAERARLDAESRCRSYENSLSHWRSQAEIIRGTWQGDVRDVVSALNRAAEHRLRGPRDLSPGWMAAAVGAAGNWQAVAAPILGMGILTRAAVTTGRYTDAWRKVLGGPKFLRIDPNTFMRYKRSEFLQHIKSLGGAEGAKGGLVKQIIDNRLFQAANKTATAIDKAARGVSIAQSLLDITQGATGRKEMDQGDYLRAGADVLASSLKTSKNPVSYLAGVNVSIWSDVVETGNEALRSGDFTLRGLPSPFSWDSISQVYAPTAKEVGGELVGMMTKWF